MSVAMTDETETVEKDSFDNEFDSNVSTEDDDGATMCDASFSHTCACTV